MDQDFIVTGLLSELKAENIRKDVVIRGLIKVICGVVAAVLVVVAGLRDLGSSPGLSLCSKFLQPITLKIF